MTIDQTLLDRVSADIRNEQRRWSARGTSLLHLPRHERRRHMGYEPGPGEPTLDERERLAPAHPKAVAVPAVDWRSKDGQNWVTGVKYQGACGSCVAFATVAAIESLARITKHAPVGDRAGDRLPPLSEAQLFYCSARRSPQACTAGWSVTAALAYCKMIGLAPATDFPYTAGDQSCRIAEGWQDRVTRIAASRTFSTVAGMKDWLANHGPLISSFTLYDDFLAYSDGVYSKTTGASAEGGHSVAVVGYDDAESAWICKNSFDTDWGMAGYFMIKYGECGIDHTMWAPASLASIYELPTGA